MKKLISASLLGLVLAACGGGGDSSSSTGGTGGTGGIGGTGGTTVASCPALTNPGFTYQGASATGEIVWFDVSADLANYRYVIKKSIDATRLGASYCGTLTVTSAGDYQMSEFLTGGVEKFGLNPRVRISKLTGSPVLLAAIKGTGNTAASPFIGFKNIAGALPTSGEYVLLGNETIGNTNALFNARVNFTGAPAICTSITNPCSTAATVSAGTITSTFNFNSGTMIIGQVAGKSVPLFVSNASDGSGMRVGFPVVATTSATTDGTYTVDRLFNLSGAVTLAGTTFTGAYTGALVFNSPVNGLETVGSLTVGADNTTGLAVFSDSSVPDVSFGLHQ